MAYVTTDIALDRMVEDAMDREWEELNDSAVWDKKLEAVGHINAAEEYFDKGIEILALAVEKVEGTTGEDRVASIKNEFEDLLCDLRDLKQKFIKGE